MRVTTLARLAFSPAGVKDFRGIKIDGRILREICVQRDTARKAWEKLMATRSARMISLIDREHISALTTWRRDASEISLDRMEGEKKPEWT